MPTMTEGANVKKLEVGFHAGNVIQYLAEAYGTGFEVVREGVQNAIDKHARNVYVEIDCQKHLVSVYDDGNGANEVEVAQKFSNIGLSLKLGQADMMGQKGIGNLAAFSIGSTWQLFTKDILKGGRLVAYTFQRSELSKGSDVTLQSETVAFKSPPGAPFPATTMLRITDVDQGVLRQLGDKATIERTLREAFNAKLRGEKISLRVSYRNAKGQATDFIVKPTKFRGTELESVEYETKYGLVTFEFYHSFEPHKDPSILVLHQGVYSIPLSNFFKLKILDRELEPLFEKGYFEGEIRLGFCKLNAQRTVFENSPEQEAFVGAVNSFAKEILKPLIDQFESAGRQERLKRIAESVLKKMRQFLNKNPNLLPPNLKSILIKNSKDGGGSEGSETVTSPPPQKRTMPPNVLKVQRKKSTEGGAQPKKPLLELRDGLAIHVVNPEADESFNWHSRLTPQGIIQINAMNNTFSEAERRGQTVLHRYMLVLVEKELTCASMPPPEARVFDQGFEKTFLNFWKASILE